MHFPNQFPKKNRDDPPVHASLSAETNTYTTQRTDHKAQLIPESTSSEGSWSALVETPTVSTFLATC